MHRHIKWFVDPVAFPTDYGLLLSAPVLAAFAIAAATVAVSWWIQRTLPEPRAAKVLERYADRAPLVLGLHLGFALVTAALFGVLFVPSLRVPEGNAFGFAVLTLEASGS